MGGKLIRFTVNKAERAGKTVVLVNPYNTSQRCSACGEIVPKKLKDREHICSRCGLIICRDLNASMGIRTLGLRGIACGEPTYGFGLCTK
ncbi:MAG: transposase [Methanothrix sp.]|nr:transposase [Methanothrix sp.]